MRHRLAFICIIIISLVACRQTTYEHEIASIDSLLVQLDTLDLMHRRIDTSDFATLGKEFTENLAFVQKTYTLKEDTMPKDVAMLMSEYRGLKKPAKGFKDKYQRTAEELNFAKSQLADLRHDLQNNLLDSVFVDEMLTDEKEAVKSISSSLEELKMSSDYTKKKREELEPKIDSLIQVLKEEKS